MVVVVLVAIPISALVLFMSSSEEAANEVYSSAGAAVPGILWTIFYILASIIFQFICNRFVFYVSTSNRDKWLRFRFFYAFYDYNLMVRGPRALKHLCPLATTGTYLPRPSVLTFGLSARCLRLLPAHCSL